MVERVDTDIGELLERYRNGDGDAASELVERFGGRILAVVRMTLNPRLRGLFDSQDFQQAVWASFFANVDRIEHTASPEAIGRWLAVVARNKVVEEGRRRLYSQARSVGREVVIDDVDCVEPLLSREPSPSERAVADEQWSLLNRGLTPMQSTLLALKRSGATLGEIAEKLGISERTVRRTITRLATRFDK
jgi:RNA polymerase sigma factor (sigma-70 family)